MAVHQLFSASDVLRPDSPLDLSPNTRYVITIQSVDTVFMQHKRNFLTPFVIFQQ
jgi:hypothetical protein